MRRLGHGIAAAGLAALSACASHGAAGAAERVPQAEIGSREQTADQQVKQALNRVAFGARPGDYERVRAIGVDRWIAQQLAPERIDDRVADQAMAHYPTLRMSPAELVQAYPLPAMLRREMRMAMVQDGAAPAGQDTTGGTRAAVAFTREDSVAVRQAAQASRRVVLEVQSAKVARAVMSNRQLLEVMTDFWENHFNVYAGKGPERYFLASYERDAIRPHALGRFRDLLGAVARSPAMLFYLDNWESSVALEGDHLRTVSPFAPRRPRGLNENYGRELLELHTLGVDGGYTQADVIDAARALTGWSIAAPRRGGGFVFRPPLHDAGSKTILGHRLPAGRGIADGEELLDIVARHPATARFIATKLVRRFVSDTVPPALVDRAADTFTRTDGDIREVMRTILTSPEFFSLRAYRSKVKSPFELVVSALRVVGASPDSTPRTAAVIGRLGEPLFGHQAPNGYPETGDAWINTGSILARINFGLSLAAGRLPGASVLAWEEGAKLTDVPRTAQVEGVIAGILSGEASPDTRRVLESGVNPMLALTAPAADSLVESRTPSAASMPDDEAPASGPASRARAEPRGLAQVVGLALGAPEFQRR